MSVTYVDDTLWHIARADYYLVQNRKEGGQDSGLVSHLHLDSDGVEETDIDSGLCDVSMDSALSEPTWDPELTSPALHHLSSSPQNKVEIPRKHLSPICLNFEESDEDVTLPINHFHVTKRSPRPSLTPPHKKLRSLRLYDTPHTPKSLLQKSQRRVSRLNKSRISFNNSFADCNKSDTSIHNSSGTRLMLDPTGPQTNVNPFTPNVCNSGSKANSTMKRTRNNRLVSMNSSIRHTLLI